MHWSKAYLEHNLQQLQSQSNERDSNKDVTIEPLTRREFWLYKHKHQVKGQKDR